MTKGNFKNSASIEINKKALELKAQGKKVVNLSIGQPRFFLDEEIKKLLNEAIETNNNFYTVSAGISDFRKQILKWHKWEVKFSVDNLLVTPGAKNAIFTSIKALINPGDEVIVFAPYWISYIEMIELCGGIVKVVQPKENLNLNLNLLKEVLTSRTKAIIVNNPNNPSGKLLSLDEIKEILNIANEKNLFIIADEIYSTITFGKSFISFSDFMENNNVVIINGVSKSLSCTGLRIGYILASKEILRKIMPVHQHISTCAGSLEQYALSKLDETRYEKIVEEYNFEYSKARSLLLNCEKIKGVGIIPEGAFYMLLNIKKKYKNSTQASEDLLLNYGIATVPGIAYGIDDYIRISFAGDISEIEGFIEIVEENNLF